MKNFKNICLLFFFSIFLFSSCETLELDQTEDPSAANVKLLDPVYAFNYLQVQLPGFVDDVNSFTQRVTRQMAMTGGNTYNNAFAPVNFNGSWSSGYNILQAINIMKPKATADGNNFILGASQVIRCYVLMTLVDLYGDVPYSEANLGNGNLTPKYDKDELVYASIINELDQAITTLGLPTPQGVKSEDYYYANGDNGISAKWITLANTLKLKMYNNCNLLTTLGGKNINAEINAIIAANNIIDTVNEDFAFSYGNTRFNPNSRHPLYNDQYELGGGAYISNYFMWVLTTEKGSTSDFANSVDDPGDPRADFYFVRQDSDPSNDDTFTLPGRSRPDHYNDSKYASFFDPTIKTPYTVSNWCGQVDIQTKGFWGRDHGNNSGTPPDNDKRTCAGVYPIGGFYSPTNNSTLQTSGTKGKLGAGIMPIILSSYVHFIKAELMLKGVISGNVQTELDLAIQQSLDKTTGLFSDYPVLTTLASNKIAQKKLKYINFINSVFSTLDTNGQLELIIKEYYIASWGNGIEPYNNYRRTSYPSNFQPTLEPVSGLFFNRAYYSGNAVNNNPNVPSNDRNRKIFWAVPNTTILN